MYSERFHWAPLGPKQPDTCTFCAKNGKAIGTFGDVRLCRQCLRKRAIRNLEEAQNILAWLEDNPPTLEWRKRV